MAIASVHSDSISMLAGASPASDTASDTCDSVLHGGLSTASALIRQRYVSSMPAAADHCSATEQQPEAALGAELSALIVGAKTVLSALVDALRAVQMRTSTTETKRIGKFNYTYVHGD